MHAARALALLLLAGGLAVAVSRMYAAPTQSAPEPEFVPGEGGESYTLGAFDWADIAQPVDDISAAIYELGNEVMGQNAIPSGMSPEGNVRAFLDAIKRCEGTANAPDPYRVCYAYRHSIVSFVDHPADSGEWGGEPLTAQQCAGAGLGPGCVSTAAGAYQIIRRTWRDLRGSLGLPDFSPASQDAAAVELLRRCGALSRIQAGDLAGAVSRAKRTWASLPGANYAGQGMRSLAQVQAWYVGSGGALA